MSLQAAGRDAKSLCHISRRSPRRGKSKDRLVRFVTFAQFITQDFGNAVAVRRDPVKDALADNGAGAQAIAAHAGAPGQSDKAGPEIERGQRDPRRRAGRSGDQHVPAAVGKDHRPFGAIRPVAPFLKKLRRTYGERLAECRRARNALPSSGCRSFYGKDGPDIRNGARR